MMSSSTQTNANPLQTIESIQQQWLIKVPKKLNLGENGLDLPTNIKAVIGQVDEKDQRRESLILMAQMQAILDKPQPETLRPQLEELPKMEGYRLLIRESKVVNQLCIPILRMESIHFKSALWGFLAQNKILIRPRTYIALFKQSIKKDRNTRFPLLNFDTYHPWKKWYLKATGEKIPSRHTPNYYADEFLTSTGVSEEEQNKHLQSAIDNLEFKNNRLSQKNEEWQAGLSDLREMSYRKLANHFNLTLNQLVDAFDPYNFTLHYAEYFYAHALHHEELSQEVIDRAYIKMLDFINDRLEQNSHILYPWRALKVLGPRTSFEIKRQASYQFIFHKNFTETHTTAEYYDMMEINNTITARLTPEEVLLCCEVFSVCSGSGTDALPFYVSQQTAEQCIQHILDKTPEDKLQYIEKRLCASLRLNLQLRKEKKYLVD